MGELARLSGRSSSGEPARFPLENARHGGQARAQIIVPAFANPDDQLDLPTDVEILDRIGAGATQARDEYALVDTAPPTIALIPSELSSPW